MLNESDNVTTDHLHRSNSGGTELRFLIRFTQQSYRRIRKATIAKILEGTLTIDNESLVASPVSDAGAVSTKRLEKGNQSDNSAAEYPPP